MKKTKILSMLLVTMLLFVFTLAGCSQQDEYKEKLEKAGYEVKIFSKDNLTYILDLSEENEFELEWAIVGLDYFSYRDEIDEMNDEDFIYEAFEEAEEGEDGIVILCLHDEKQATSLYRSLKDSIDAKVMQKENMIFIGPKSVVYDLTK